MYYLKKKNFTAYTNQKKKRPEVNGVALWADIDIYHPIDDCLYQKAPNEC